MTAPTVPLISLQCMECKSAIGGDAPNSELADWVEKHRHEYKVGETA